MPEDKGVSLPINALIVILLAIIVLGAALALFTGVWNPGTQATEETGNFNAFCAEYAAQGCCPVPAQDADISSGCQDITDSYGEEIDSDDARRCCQQAGG